MTRKSLNLFLCLPLAVLLSAGPALAGSPGDAGVLSLRLGVGAREAGMGEAGVASSSGASAVYWNPANNVFADFETELVLQHQRYLGLFDQDAAAVAHRAGSGVLGFIFTGLLFRRADPLQRRAGGGARGHVSPYDVAFGVSYAMPLGESFGVGATAKMVYEKIDVYADTGFAFDLFVTHQAVIDGLVFAASVTNLGGQMNLNDQPFDLPTRLPHRRGLDPGRQARCTAS